MSRGFIRIAAATTDIRVADCEFNADRICDAIDEAYGKGTQLIVFPELCITGYTCSDLFWQSLMLEGAVKATTRIAEHTKDKEILVLVGLPYECEGKLYNVAAVLYMGEILGLIPKYNIPNYSEFYEARHFTPGNREVVYVSFDGKKVPMGMNLLFKSTNIKGFVLGTEICEDVWVADSPSISHVLSGATVIANLSASDEVTGKDIYRKNMIMSQSAKLVCGYVYSDAGEGESTTDLVFAGHNMIVENGTMLAESKRFENGIIYGELDLDRIINERRRMTTFRQFPSKDYTVVEFDMGQKDIALTRKYDNAPFVPGNKHDREKRCEEILMIQSMGLKKRLVHTQAKSAVIGISGGLDSTLALLVTVRAFDMAGIDRKHIIAVTMPGFGTTDRTYTNALTLIRKLGATLIEINIADAANAHFNEIGHDPSVHDVTYENVQARQRTLYLMNLANEHNGIVIGTGDMSELALGWATYNGDHMSMYGVNASVPKTLVRHLVRYYADTCDSSDLTETLLDVLDTPVSPELLPPDKDGNIAQKTEDLVGPYELHDFFMYYVLRLGYTPSKIYDLATNAFDGIYDSDTIKKWLKTFYRRFFSQQFKRSCLPDGPKVGSVAVSPRGDLRMPSDGCVKMWLDELETI